MSPPRDQQLQHYLTLFNSPTADWSAAEQLIAPDYLFSDPFHQLQGLTELRRYLAYMHRQFDQVRFTPEVVAWQEHHCLLRWRCEASWQRKQLDFRGVSELECDPHGRFRRHTDYWDAAEHFYAELPILGRVLRWTKGRVQRDFVHAEGR
ncbi:nuclear transport factor 2 family protein [Motiliproteus sediminis]|uniref:nuclear transport factor 2 family protein n=1 Tax=Motiliproteus sediminis TaxID=1468178 RepID=UPI001AEFF507|nr:nuclear transport factor 2 family protein [Motiliproteus sediminis]